MIINNRTIFTFLITATLLLGMPIPYHLYGQMNGEKKGKIFVLPIITRSVETGWNFGALTARIFPKKPSDSLSRSSNLEILGMYSSKQQVLFALNGTQYFNNETYILEEQLSTSYFPDKFWGIGKYTPDNAEEAYSFRQAYMYLHLKRKIAPHFFGGFVYESQKVWDINYVKGGLLDNAALPGMNGYFISGVGASLSYDSRNNAFAPDKGYFLQIFWNHFDKAWGSDCNYTNWVADFRTYIPITKSSVLAMQYLNFSTNGAEVPIRSLAAFGGASKMRGYYEGRYRDKNQMFLQSEYRFPIYKFIHAIVFSGLGSVASQWKDYSIADLKMSAGGGLRFALSKKEKLSLRIDYGIGQGNNQGFYFQLGEAF